MGWVSGSRPALESGARGLPMLFFRTADYAINAFMLPSVPRTLQPLIPFIEIISCPLPLM